MSFHVHAQISVICNICMSCCHSQDLLSLLILYSVFCSWICVIYTLVICSPWEVVTGSRPGDCDDKSLRIVDMPSKLHPISVELSSSVIMYYIKL